MKHFLLDCKCSDRALYLDDERYIFYKIKQICEKLKVNPISQPILRPYIYECNQNDEGVSCVVLLEGGGHITFHSFTTRKCYYMDILVKSLVLDDSEVFSMVNEHLPYLEDYSVLKRCFKNEVYNKKIHFGPHIIYNLKCDLDFEKIYDLLNEIPEVIGMTKITSPIVVKDKDNIDGIVIIAESHISIHYNNKQKKAYVDIFSCMPFDIKNTNKLFKSIGRVLRKRCFARYTKYELEEGKQNGKV